MQAADEQICEVFLQLTDNVRGHKVSFLPDTILTCTHSTGNPLCSRDQADKRNLDIAIKFLMELQQCLPGVRNLILKYLMANATNIMWFHWLQNPTLSYNFKCESSRSKTNRWTLTCCKNHLPKTGLCQVRNFNNICTARTAMAEISLPTGLHLF